MQAKVVFAQINPMVGDIAGNAAKILTEAREAAASGASVFVTPELSICGYPPEDWVSRKEFLASCGDAVRKLASDLRDLTDLAVIVGTPFEARCDTLILVTAPYETSVARICARDGIAPEMARRRLDAQTPLETLRAAATAELVNDSTPDALREKLRSVLNGLEKEGTCQKPKSEKEAF